MTATTHDWFSAGHPDRAGGEWTLGPWQARLTLAGSETSPREAGYLAGAVEASRRAANAVNEPNESRAGRDVAYIVRGLERQRRE
jgi:hypothetical protein